MLISVCQRGYHLVLDTHRLLTTRTSGRPVQKELVHQEALASDGERVDAYIHSYCFCGSVCPLCFQDKEQMDHHPHPHIITGF